MKRSYFASFRMLHANSKYVRTYSLIIPERIDIKVLENTVFIEASYSKPFGGEQYKFGCTSTTKITNLKIKFIIVTYRKLF